MNNGPNSSQMKEYQGYFNTLESLDLIHEVRTNPRHQFSLRLANIKSLIKLCW